MNVLTDSQGTGPAADSACSYPSPGRSCWHRGEGSTAPPLQAKDGISPSGQSVLAKGSAEVWLPGRAWASLRGTLQVLGSQAGGSASVGTDALGLGVGAATEKGLMPKTGIA